jgi:hypothetical protein
MRDGGISDNSMSGGGMSDDSTSDGAMSHNSTGDGGVSDDVASLTSPLRPCLFSLASSTSPLHVTQTIRPPSVLFRQLPVGNDSMSDGGMSHNSTSDGGVSDDIASLTSPLQPHLFNLTSSTSPLQPRLSNLDSSPTAASAITA